MAEHGGYRKPGNPAPVSGPGALSRRTDGGPAKMTVEGLSYGDNAAVNELQSAAPLSTPGGSSQPAPQMQQPVGLGEPTAYPEQPVTAGADAGLGPSAADIGLTDATSNHEIRQKLGPMAPVLMRMADSPYATAAYRRQVRQFLARINS